MLHPEGMQGSPTRNIKLYHVSLAYSEVNQSS